MKLVRLIMSVFMMIFSLAGLFGLISFDIVLPVVIVGIAYITYIDAKRLAREKREAEARSLMNVVIFMGALIMVYFITKLK